MRCLAKRTLAGSVILPAAAGLAAGGCSGNGNSERGEVLPCDLPSIHAFTRGLDLDHSAAIAAVTLPFHNGRTEGVNTKTKLIKRQMYGRQPDGVQLVGFRSAGNVLHVPRVPGPPARLAPRQSPPLPARPSGLTFLSGVRVRLPGGREEGNRDSNRRARD